MEMVELTLNSFNEGGVSMSLEARGRSEGVTIEAAEAVLCYNKPFISKFIFTAKHK